VPASSSSQSEAAAPSGGPAAADLDKGPPVLGEYFNRLYTATQMLKQYGLGRSEARVGRMHAGLHGRVHGATHASMRKGPHAPWRPPGVHAAWAELGGHRALHGTRP
jgi:hypothetical protein